MARDAGSYFSGYADALYRFQNRGPYSLGPYNSQQTARGVRFRFHRFKGDLLKALRNGDMVSADLYEIADKIIMRISHKADGEWYVDFDEDPFVTTWRSMEKAERKKREEGQKILLPPDDTTPI